MIEKEIVYHIVNSVKGGGGKSTFALLLAAYYIRKGETALVMDLDIDGSSWEIDFRDHWEKPFYNNITTPYGIRRISELMYSSSESLSNEFFNVLKFKYYVDDDTVCEIPVCISSDGMCNYLDDYDIGMLENCVNRILKKAITLDSFMKEEDIKKKKKTGHNKPDENNTIKKILNVIIDMPPSHENHSEKVFRHLMFEMNVNPDKSINHSINLYLISPAEEHSSFEKNLEYLCNLLKNRSYTNTIEKYLSETKFKARFIINDNHKVIDSFGLDGFQNKILYILNARVNQQMRSLNYKDLNPKCYFLNNLKIEYVEQRIKSMYTVSSLDIIPTAISISDTYAIDELMGEMKVGPNND